VQSTSILTAPERDDGGNRRGGANANQGQRDPAAPGFGNAIRQQKSYAERQGRAGADDEAEQWGIQDEVHASLSMMMSARPTNTLTSLQAVRPSPDPGLKACATSPLSRATARRRDPSNDHSC